MSKTIEINIFDTNSIDKGIKEIKKIQKILKEVIPYLFILKSLEWIRDKANEYHDKRQGEFPNTINIKDHWQIRFDENSKSIYKVSAKLTNTDKEVHL